MRRVMIGVIAILGCEPREPCGFDGRSRTRPQLCLERNSLDWGSGDFGRGVLVGTNRIDTLGVENGGRETLRFSSLSIEGPAFSIQEPPSAIEGGEGAAVRVVFAPPAPGRFEARLNLESNAENFPIRTIELHACGETRDGGFSCDP